MQNTVEYSQYSFCHLWHNCVQVYRSNKTSGDEKYAFYQCSFSMTCYSVEISVLVSHVDLWSNPNHPGFSRSFALSTHIIWTCTCMQRGRFIKAPGKGSFCHLVFTSFLSLLRMKVSLSYQDLASSLSQFLGKCCLPGEAWVGIWAETPDRARLTQCVIIPSQRTCWVEDTFSV